jgi:hypothetical protein
VSFLLLLGITNGSIPSALFASAPEVMPEPRLTGAGMAALMLGQNAGFVVGPALFAALLPVMGWLDRRRVRPDRPSGGRRGLEGAGALTGCSSPARHANDEVGSGGRLPLPPQLIGLCSPYRLSPSTLAGLTSPALGWRL